MNSYRVPNVRPWTQIQATIRDMQPFCSEIWDLACHVGIVMCKHLPFSYTYSIQVYSLTPKHTKHGWWCSDLFENKTLKWSQVLQASRHYNKQNCLTNPSTSENTESWTASCQDWSDEESNIEYQKTHREDLCYIDPSQKGRKTKSTWEIINWPSNLSKNKGHPGKKKNLWKCARLMK